MKNFVITETISYIIIKLFHNFIFGTFRLNNPIRYVNGNSLIFCNLLLEFNSPRLVGAKQRSHLRGDGSSFSDLSENPEI